MTGRHPKEDFDAVAADVIQAFEEEAVALAALYPGLEYDSRALTKDQATCKKRGHHATRVGRCSSIAFELAFAYGLSRDERFRSLLERWIESVLNLRGIKRDAAEASLARAIDNAVEGFPQYWSR